MKSRFVLDKYVTPLLAVFTAVLLVIGGCENSPKHDSGADVSSTTTGERPDPSIPQGENLQRPEGWVVRMDRPDPEAVIGGSELADIFFVNMTPGWHITTHKSAIFYHPANLSSEDFTATADFYFFDPGESQKEAYGLLFGGTELDSESQSYGYFVVRNTGEFLIKQRSGRETSVVQDWTPSESVNTISPEDEESILNQLSVRVEGDQIHFILNGENVATHPTSALPSRGVVGLRINHGVNVHVSDLRVDDE